MSVTPQFKHTNLTDSTYTTVTGGQVIECSRNGLAQVYSGLRSTAHIIQAEYNLEFATGVVHIVDRVLQIPGNFSSTADYANLTALLGAIETTNLGTVIESLKDVTIFAPSNDAFQAIGSTTSSLTTTQLSSILQYHILINDTVYSANMQNGSLTALSGGTLRITNVDGAIFVNSARVVNPDILLANGVLHIIDAVLNPINTAVIANAAATASPAFSGASSATAVPFTSGMAGPSTAISALLTTISNVVADYSGSIATGSSQSAGASKSTGSIVSSTGGANGSGSAGSASGKERASPQAIGIGVGVGVGGAVLLLVVGAFCLKQRHRRQKQICAPPAELHGTELDRATMLSNEGEKHELEHVPQELPASEAGLSQEAPAQHGESEASEQYFLEAASRN
ncbi:hypothetical protein LTR86_011248 [Recurvomyces mirabilis]|nr:hypothetical protein LTR86_011248 [Recurvomyces mirabilis]